MAKSKTQYGQPANYNATPATRSDGDASAFEIDSTGNQLMSMGTKLAGEDGTNDVLKVEQRYSYVQAVADTPVKSGVGFVHSITISQADVAPTAGTISLYDSLTEAAPLIFQEYITTGVFSAHTVILDVNFTTGLYLGFNGPGDVNVTVSYR